MLRKQLEANELKTPLTLSGSESWMVFNAANGQGCDNYVIWQLGDRTTHPQQNYRLAKLEMKPMSFGLQS